TRKVNGEFFKQMSENSARQIDTAEAIAANLQLQQLSDLNLNTIAAREEIRLAVESIYENGESVERGLNTIASVTREARQALAKYAGAEFVELEQGKVPIELSTVYRRLYDINLVRYEQ